MIIVGLTGSIGMGKSTVAAMFRKGGVPVFDADAEVRRLQGPSGALIPAIEARFPGSTDDKGVRRDHLGQRVFGNSVERAALEAIVLPVVAQQRQCFLRQNRSRPIVVLDIPLLFESGGADHVDVVIVVSAPAWKQARRVLARPGMTRTKFRQIVALQLPDAAKRQRADFVIDTGGTLDRTRDQIRRLITCLSAIQRR